MATGCATGAGRRSLARSAVRTIPSTPMGTRRKKIHRQLTTSITSPPTGGPRRRPPWKDMVMKPLARRSRSVRGIIAVATLDPVGLDALQDVARPDEPGVHSQHAEQLDRRRELGARPRMIADVAPHHAALDAHACQQGTHLELFC